MIDACLTDGSNLDYGSDGDSEFGGAASSEEAAASSPEPAPGSISDAVESPLPAVASSDSNLGETAPEGLAAGGQSVPTTAGLPQGWKLAEDGSERARPCRDGAAAAPFRQLSCGGMQLPVCAGPLSAA